MDYTLDSTLKTPLHSLELAARNIEKAIVSDNSAPTLVEVMNVSPQSGATASGLTDYDYPNLSNAPVFSNTSQIKTFNKVPLPPEIMEHFSHMQCHCMMGLFTEINRAWLTIDSDIYIWTYEEGSDVAYFDGLSETIVNVGLVLPKSGVFHSFIKYLLILTTAVDVAILGVTFSPGPNGSTAEIQLIPDPVFTIPTDGLTITTIAGTSHGRIFYGCKDGSLYEISYQAESSWFGKRCKKINHSTSTLSYFMPSFLNAALNEEDGITQISIDNSRNILYTLTEKGTIEVYDMGEKGNSFSKVCKLTQTHLVQQAMNTVKTLDSQNFRPIVSISSVESYESGYVNLVAVTQTGVRFYLTVVGLSYLQPNQRPYTLTLLHVRLPPGYSANMSTRPRMVHMANYSAGNLMLLSTVNEKDVLWCLSSDIFPFNSCFMEAYTALPLDGPAWAMAKVRHNDPSLPTGQQLPPLVVRQHSQPPHKYVVLTAQGAHIFLKLRPVDILKQLFLDSRGPDSELIKSFFMIQKDDQACATSLVLACLENAQNADISEWATKAFFTFGGEPKVNNMALGTNQTAGTSFQPNVVSTPIHSPRAVSRLPSLNQSQTFGNHFLLPAKHNSLYLYLGRILRSVWNLPCVEKISTEDNKIYLMSTLSSDDCVWILSHLNSLRTFLLKNTQLSVNATVVKAQNSSNANANRSNQILQDIQFEERQSLDAYKTFVDHCAQLIGFWRILCEHQFHILVDALSPQHQQILQNMMFRDLLLYGQEICSLLIANLINSYLGDDASVDSISVKLREVCPNLYKNEDAACSKANEILKSAKAQQNVNEKKELLVQALNLCKDVAPNIDLHSVCQQFAALESYHAVIDLCVTAARKSDPDNIAEHFYKSSDRVNNQDSYRYYARKMEIYKEILWTLDNCCSRASNSPNLSHTIGPNVRAEVENITKQTDNNFVILQILNDALQYPDELLHVSLYEWMINKQMHSDLIKIREASLETYLMQASQQNPDNIVLSDLLWKYYENNNNHALAAKILNNLATKPGNFITLKERLSYLARAIMCMRSDKVGYAPYLGIFLRELEDTIEIAKVQEQILDAITNLISTHSNAEEAVTVLNSGLYEITQLYEDFADPFKLWECKLAIIQCAGYSDPDLIESIWINIFQTELKRGGGTGDDKLMQVLAKIRTLARYYKSTNCFPKDFMVRELEIMSAKLKANPALVPKALLNMDLQFTDLMDIYNQLVSTSLSDRFWSSEGREFHLFEAIAAIINIFLTNHEQYNNVEKRKIISSCQDTIAGLLSNLYSKPNTEGLVNVLRAIQTRLSRL